MALESFPLLDRQSRQRIETDVPLSFGLYLVLGFITLGIYSLYVFYKQVARQQEHFKRMSRFNDDLFKVVDEQAQDTNKTAEVSSDIEEMRRLNEDFQRLQQGKERSAALWLIITIITLGLAAFYVYYFLNKDLVEHQRAEAEYIEKSSALLNKLGIGRAPVTVEQVVPERSFALYLLLSIVTLGIFVLYWVYALIKDGNEHFQEHQRFEDQLLGLIRAQS